MKTNLLKQATLRNVGAWTTIITWEGINDNKGTTRITKKQIYDSCDSIAYLTELTFNDFDKAYNTFHKMLSEWI